jgi:hypothetical protein
MISLHNIICIACIIIMNFDIDICVLVYMYKYTCVHNEFMYIL